MAEAGNYFCLLLFLNIFFKCNIVLETGSVDQKVTGLKKALLRRAPWQNWTQDLYIYIFAMQKEPNNNNKSVALVRERTIPTERPSLVGEVSANFCGKRDVS
jgi:hypothetical protein